MKNLYFMLIVFLLQACNQSIKTTPEKPASNAEAVTNVAENVTDTAAPTYNAEDELRIKRDSLSRVGKAFPFMSKYSFENYNAAHFEGAPATPDFKGSPFANNPEYIAFITEGCKRGINFGGHYTLIEKSCGAMCVHLFMIDRRDGKIFIDSFGLKEQDGYYGFAYKKDSNLLVANATSLTDASRDQMDEFSIKPEVFRWDGRGFVRVE